MASRPRGRPQRLPHDPTPLEDPSFDCTRRMAWLLATSRLLSATGGLGREEFMVRTRAHGLSLDSARISRLEAGLKVPDRRTLAGYEAVCGLPEGSLVAAHHLLRRTSGAVRTTEPLRARNQLLVEGVLDDTFDRIERHRATGGHWLRLAHELTEGPDNAGIYLPPRAWRDLSGQLVSELTRSSGLAFLRRYEAAAVLMTRETSQRHLSRSLGRFVMDADAQSVSPALTLLREVGDRAAGELIVRLMSGDNQLLRRGAIGVAAAMAARDDLPEGSLEVLELHAGHELRKGGALTRRTDAIDLVTQLPDPGFDRVLAAIGDPRMRLHVDRARTTRQLADPALSRSISEGVAAYAEAAAGRNAHDPDLMLRRLVQEALFHAQRERRQSAAVMLGLSPYARSVADALLRLATDEPDELIAGLAWSSLRRLTHVLGRNEIAAAAAAERRPGLRARALVTVGLSRGPLDPPSADMLLDDALSGDVHAVQHGAIFALGMADHSHLHTLAGHPDDGCSRAAKWWRGVGSAIHDDADVPAPASTAMVC